jgi:hypothetical protein
MSVNIIGAYKSWYITTACVAALTVLFLLSGILEFRGLFGASLIIAVYYLYLLLTAAWAEYPETTIWYALADTIFIVIFALFYLLSMNFSVTHMTDFFVHLIPPAFIIFIISYVIDPEAIRIGYYVLPFLPFLFLFCILQLMAFFSIRSIVYATTCLFMLVVGMSRTPLLAAGVGVILIFLTSIKQWTTRLKFVAAFISIGLLLTFTILAYQPFRLYAAKTLARITYQDVAVGEETIQSEEIDVVRWAIFADAISLFQTNWMFGIGYMNFMPWFGDEYSYRFEDVRDREVVGMSLHNSFQTWALEGGLPCLAIVTLLLWKYFGILRRRITQSESNIEKAYYKTYSIAMICSLIMGLFHQIHQTPVFYILLGSVYALGGKKRFETLTLSDGNIYMQHLRKEDMHKSHAGWHSLGELYYDNLRRSGGMK